VPNYSTANDCPADQDGARRSRGAPQRERSSPASARCSSARTLERALRRDEDRGVQGDRHRVLRRAPALDGDPSRDRGGRRSFNANPDVHSILVQLPLPDGIDEGAGPAARQPPKDVDGLHPTNLGRLVMGAPGPLPCTPAGHRGVARGVPRARRRQARRHHRTRSHDRTTAGAADVDASSRTATPR
jgi:hypothetical protein